MSITRGSENLPPQQVPPTNPFAVISEAEANFPSPFAASPQQNSPFRASDEPIPVQGKIPARKTPNFPFEVPDSQPGFGFEAGPSPFTIAPLEAGPAGPVPTGQLVPQSLVAVQGFVPAASVLVHAAAPAFAPPPPQHLQPQHLQPQQLQPQQPQHPQPQPVAVVSHPVMAPVFSQPAAAPVQAPSLTPRPAALPMSSFGNDQHSDSFSIRQLELRAIFGMDRELNADELMQRSRALPGVRHVARVRAEDIPAIEGMKQVVANLGFAGNVKLQVESGPLEFIRESGVLLAVQTESGFLPGIRETLIIVARELSRGAS